ncbi:hypothetical protein C8J57DRAFT_1287086 [Mycena rebaudengoi]|nr:hypothetical protein C8J57DRAFT_1287086 [Mycena rebaudengoi]
MSPLDIPELVAECIGYLEASPTDLAACSRVQHSWTYTAQSHIFRSILISVRVRPILQGPCDRQCTLDERCMQLLELLSASPHLTTFVVYLELDPTLLSPASFATLAQCPFPKLRKLRMSTSDLLTGPLVAGMQRLLSTPSLHHIQLYSEVDVDLFPRIWDSAALSIRRMLLSLHSFTKIDSATVSSLPPATRKIPIESLALICSPGPMHWLMAPPDQVPFDFSHLKVLHLPTNNTALLRAPAFAAAAATLELLNLEVDWTLRPAVNLAAFSCLATIHIACTSWKCLPMVIDTLRTISPTNRIREIIVYWSDIGEKGREQIVQRLANTPLPYLQTLKVQASAAGISKKLGSIVSIG